MLKTRPVGENTQRFGVSKCLSSHLAAEEAVFFPELEPWQFYQAKIQTQEEDRISTSVYVCVL